MMPGNKKKTKTINRIYRESQVIRIKINGGGKVET